ncbi:hypothetical protein GmHk_15G044204 [Glycine max]|nr:hypothetical protein GmHk_15G044204 [Glycine max]
MRYLSPEVEQRHFLSSPKKSEQKIGESVAFFTYVKATTLKSNIEESAHVDNSNNTTITTTTTTTTLRMKDMNQACTKHGDDLPSSNSIPNSFSIERSCTPRNGSQGFVPAQHAYPYYILGFFNHVILIKSFNNQSNNNPCSGTKHSIAMKITINNAISLQSGKITLKATTTLIPSINIG